MDPRYRRYWCMSSWLAAAVGLLVFSGGCANLPPPAAKTSHPPTPAPASVVILPTGARPVLVVQATSSSPDERERGYAEKITQRMAEWIEASGIPVKRVTDDQFTRNSGTGARVAVLPYNPKPGQAQLQACRRFTEGGGKLIVLYSTEPQLASLMGLKLGTFRTAPGTDSWKAFRFEGAPAGVPAHIEQNSRNIMPAFPSAPGSRVIAWWETDSGRGAREPAWTQSDRGFWMSHVLLESDSDQKQKLLTGLLGACDRDLWQVAAAKAVTSAGTLNRYATFSQTLSAIRSQARRGGQEDSVQALLTRASTLNRSLASLYQQKDYPRAWDSAQEVD